MRKGNHPISIVLIFIILVLVIMVSAGILIVIRNMYGNADEDAKCAAQISASSFVTRASKELAAPTITCPTQRVVVEKGTSANEAIAGEMKRCWALWGRGKTRLFGDKEGVYCHVCSMVTVSEPVNGLAEYLDTHKANNDQTYSQYLAATTEGNYFADAQGKPQASTIPAGQPIGVIFYYAKGTTFLKELHNKVTGQIGVGIAGGLITGVIIAKTAAVSIPTMLILSVGGGASGGIASLLSRNDLDTWSFVVVRPLTEDGIKDLGCTYAPVGN